MGPTRFCMRASILRSTQSQNKVKNSMNVKPGKTSIRKIRMKSINHVMYHRSVHEKQGSKLTKFAGTSAMLSPMAVLRNDGMLANVGVRTFTRSGMSVPLLLT